MKKKVFSALIFVTIGQVIAYFILLIFNENYFIPMLIASTVGFLAGYRNKNNVA
jgi:hypothetical protein